MIKSRLTHELGWDSRLQVWTGTAGNLSLTTDRLYPVRVQGHQVTETHSHPQFFKNRRLIKGIERGKNLVHVTPSERARLLRILKNLDYGGMFWTVRRSASEQTRYVSVPRTRISNVKDFAFQGKFLPGSGFDDLSWKSAKWPASPEKAAELNQLLVKGTTAINRTIPTSPEYSLATALGELYSDGLPSLVGSTLFRAKSLRKRLKDVGGEYLNVEFGWKPLVSDLKSLASTVRKAQKLIDQYENGSGRPIGRHYEFPEERSTTQSTVANIALYPPIDSTAFSSSVLAPQTTVTEEFRRYWFEATYTYHLPAVSSSADKMRLYAVEAEKLLGLRVTPEVLWNLAPWSWLSDWFVNYGDLISNLTNLSKDGCMLRRGYIMCTTYTKSTISHPGSVLRGWGPTGPSIITLETKAKMRRRASPWGFGVTFEGFSPRQIAILSALGLSRDAKWGTE